MDDFLAERVTPFYLPMMRTNAVTAGAEVIAAVRASSATVPVDKVRYLLAADWRPRVMGAWYALAHDAEHVGDALGRSLATSAGSLTAPPLATVATVVLGHDALPSLETYALAAENDPDLGAVSFVAAAIERVGGQPTSAPTPEDRSTLDRMLAVAAALRN